MNLIEQLNKKTLRDDIPEFRPGDTVAVHVNIIEGETQRIQVFTFNKDRKSTRLNSSHVAISYAVFCLKKKKESRSSFTGSISVTGGSRCSWGGGSGVG